VPDGGLNGWASAGPTANPKLSATTNSIMAPRPSVRSAVFIAASFQDCLVHWDWAQAFLFLRLPYFGEPEKNAALRLGSHQPLSRLRGS
jgi:hypothetical protein